MQLLWPISTRCLLQLLQSILNGGQLRSRCCVRKLGGSRTKSACEVQEGYLLPGPPSGGLEIGGIFLKASEGR